MAIPPDGCNVIGRHNFLEQKLEAKKSLISVYCHAHHLSAVSYYTAADLYSVVYETMKAPGAIMEVFYCVSVSIGLSGDASDNNEDKRSEVAARMQNKVAV